MWSSPTAPGRTGSRPPRSARFDLAEWSPDGTTLLFGAAMVDERTRISGPSRSTASRSGASSDRTATTCGATWSPDGLSIAYLSTVGGQTQVMVAGPDGSDPRPISDRGDWSTHNGHPMPVTC